MTAEASAGVKQRFTLDHSSFEKLLAAAWVLQCLQDHLHRTNVDRDESSAVPVKTQPDIGTANSGLPPANTLLRPLLSNAGDADGKAMTVNAPLVVDTNPAVLVQTEQLVTNHLNFDATVKFDLNTAELKSPQSEPISTAQPMEAPVPVLVNPGISDRKQWTRPRAILIGRTVFSQVLGAFGELLPNFRVKLTVNAIRAVSIATPVWLLSLIAALLFLDVWRYGSVHGALPGAPPSVSAVAALVSNPANVTAPTWEATQAVQSTGVTGTDDSEQRSTALPALESSHRRITDSAASSTVQQLSRFEIRALERQAMYGDESAAFTLGMAYEVGSSVPQSCVEAARWVTMAAESGDSAAQYNLGLRYRDGDGVPVNQAESEKWLRKAAHKNRQARLALNLLASR